jgi:hypothetical protein
MKEKLSKHIKLNIRFYKKWWKEQAGNVIRGKGFTHFDFSASFVYGAELYSRLKEL